MKINGIVLFGTYKLTKNKLPYTDKTSGKTSQAKTVFVVHVTNDDGTVDAHEIKHPEGYQAPALKPEQAYGFPCAGSPYLDIYWKARTDLMPFPAPQLT